MDEGVYQTRKVLRLTCMDHPGRWAMKIQSKGFKRGSKISFRLRKHPLDYSCYFCMLAHRLNQVYKNEII